MQPNEENDISKADIVEDVETTYIDDVGHEQSIDAKEHRRVLRKIDLMILPYLMVCYAFFYLDKTTLSYAAVFGLQEDLHLKGAEYNWLSSIFYFGFLAWAIPANLLLQKFPVGRFLGVNIMLWGIFLVLQAVCHNFTTLAVMRALGGAVEATADPSFLIITHRWYTRKEQPVRIGIWFSAQGLGVGAGGLLGYAIGHVKGSLPSWKYEFLIIGALCTIWGVIVFFFLPNSPADAPLLSERERQVAIGRLRENQTDVKNSSFQIHQLKEFLTDYKTPIFFLLGVTSSIPNGGISNFGTIVVKGFGYSTLGTSLLQVPYGALISISVLATVYINNKFVNRRCLFMMLSMIVPLAGSFGLSYVPTHKLVARLMCYYLTAFYCGAFVLILSLVTANTAGDTKKVLTSAALFLGYCTGNLSGPFFYKTEQSPTYPLGLWSMAVSIILVCILAALLWVLLRRDNLKREQYQNSSQDTEQKGQPIVTDLTDRENVSFKYIY